MSVFLSNLLAERDDLMADRAIGGNGFDRGLIPKILAHVIVAMND